MDQPEPPVRRFAEKAQGVHHEGPGQDRREMRRKRPFRPQGHVGVKPVGQGEVKAELLHHEGITPAVQQGALARGEAVGTAAGDLGRGQGRAQGIKVAHHLCRKLPQGGRIAVRYKRQEPVERRHPQPRQRHGPQPRGKRRHGRPEIVGSHAGGKPEGRLDGAVKAVTARLGGDRPGRKAKIGRRRFLTACGIAAKPPGGAVGKGAGGRRVVNGISFHIGHDGPIRRDCHTGVTTPWHGARSRPDKQD